ncbi:MAG: hypothetical protein WC327_01380 [Candidatus Cloacimonadia bacterium]|jgi:hypothetical protein
MNTSFRYLILAVLLLTACLSFAQGAEGVAEGSSIVTIGVNDNYIKPQSVLLKSVIIPGWGELTSNSNSGYIFLLTELFLWSSRYYFLEESKVCRKDAISYALAHSGIAPGSYDKEFLDLMGRYNSSGFEPGGYNESVFRKAQSLYPDDEEKFNKYLNDNTITDESLSWSWESKDHRRRFSIKRKNANHNTDYAKAVTGAIVANHLLSALNATRIAALHNKKNRIEVSVDIDRRELHPLFTLTYKF